MAHSCLVAFAAGTNVATRPATELSGTLPKEISVLTNMNLFWISRYDLRGPIQGVFDGWDKVEIIRLEQNKLTGSIPSNLDQELPRLESFWLDNNEFSGELPESLGNLVNLKSARFRNNNFEGSIPATWGNLQSLSTSSCRAAERLPQLDYLDEVSHALPLSFCDSSGLGTEF